MGILFAARSIPLSLAFDSWRNIISGKGKCVGNKQF